MGEKYIKKEEQFTILFQALLRIESHQRAMTMLLLKHISKDDSDYDENLKIYDKLCEEERAKLYDYTYLEFGTISPDDIINDE